MVELMAVVAITVILFALSMVGVVRYQGMLKLTELDNAAREIYMAAENRAVLLSGARRLKTQVARASELSLQAGRAGDGEVYVTKAQVEENGELLTVGSIDPALMDGDFYIVYNLDGGSVTDVFYAEKSMDELLADSWFESLRSEWPKSRSERLSEKLMVGYYNGEAAQGSEEDNTGKAQVFVDIANGEELTVTVTYYLPEGGVNTDAKLEVRLGTIDLTEARYNQWKTTSAPVPTTDGGYSLTWVLDSLTATYKQGGGTERISFRALGSEIRPGEDFTVTAEVSSKSGSFESGTGSDTDNSLFQYREGAGDTAYIENLRHLQNLNDSFSGVLYKTQAVQTADVRCAVSGDDGTDRPYDFSPIVNKDIVSYSGEKYKITGLYVSGTKAADTDAGLFARVEAHTSFSGVRLVNASVSAAANCDAGALVGYAEDNVTIDDCWVYWEADEDVPSLKDKLGTDAEGDEYHYQITGTNAGGLVGCVGRGNCTITGSLAATLVEGTSCAGGLIGKCEGDAFVNKVLTVRSSYADCYLKGGTNAAGLAGQLEVNTKAVLTNCYAAGYIMGGTVTAGLCTGVGSAKAENVYSIVRFPSDDAAHGLTENAADTLINAHYFGEKTETQLYDFTYMTGSGFVNEMGTAFGEKKQADSHPYDLRDNLFLAGEDYPYPGLGELPHYGDWRTQFKEPSLVYYEQYSDGTWGVSGGNARDLINNLSDTKTVESDGYGVAFLKNDWFGATEGTEKPRLTCTYYDEAGEKHTEEVPYEKLYETQWENDEGERSNYYLIILPDDMVNSGYAEDCFYRYMSFTLEVNVTAQGAYFFNPHFAETVIPVEEGSDTWDGDQVKEKAEEQRDAMKRSQQVKLRTPRHLAALSRFEEYFNRTYRFRQELDLDYARYSGYEGQFQAKSGPYQQEPIGTDGKPFTGTYEGNYRTIKNVVPKTVQYMGLFGCSEGRLQNIVYEMNPDYPLSVRVGGGSGAGYNYIGTLAGRSSGTVENCAVHGVNIQGSFSSVMVYIGGLVGWNSGDIRSCEAECALISVNCLYYSSVCAGGLAGQNDSGGDISASYAVGRIKAGLDEAIRSVTLCGLAGWNSGRISNSYAAMDLQADKETANIYGVCGVNYGTQTGNTYLNDGSFSYRDAAYTAGYEQENVTACGYQELVARTGSNQAQHSPQKTAAEPEEQYPYPAVVRNREKELIHYGRWPIAVPLGEMGVFYWEKMVDAEGGTNPSFSFSALAVNPDQNTITKQSTLSTDHDDGRVVVAYGYGYYSSKEGAEKFPVTFETENIGYTVYKKTSGDDRLSRTALNPNNISSIHVRTGLGSDVSAADVISEQKELEAKGELEKMMPEYTFHCWNSYHEGGRAAQGSYDNRVKNATSGLYLFNGTNPTNVDPNGGRFILKQGHLTVRFRINPQFADSMAVVINEGAYQLTGYTLMYNAKNGNLGILDNPFQVRCGAQLQEINWYDTCFTDVTIGQAKEFTINRFPYLSNSDSTGKYVWKQTHDIDWIKEGMTYDWGNDGSGTGVFMGIAQVKVNGDNGRVPGWFGGTYDGQNYTIKNLNIGKNANYLPNCMGLFGFVKGATLTNMVLFAEDEASTVTVEGWKAGTSRNNHGETAPYAWYAGGVLAGVALNSTISNCAVAGYTIQDNTERGRCTYEYSWSLYNGTIVKSDISGAIGGLVGMTNSSLTNCTASAEIEINCSHRRTINWETFNETSVPVCVGGLVGTTTGDVTNCYTGGSITASKASYASIYAGQLIGGVGIEPLERAVSGLAVTRAGVAVQNCYSYMKMPAQTGAVKGSYAIGTDQRGNTNPSTATLKNNYYLTNSVSSGNGQTSVTYRQLAGLENLAGGQTIYGALGGGYSRVTSSADGLEAFGRYSFVPSNRTDLQGMDYPFPTVLTMDGYHVHYGAWELNGVYFANGSGPVSLDMFTGRSTDTDAAGKQLKLAVVGEPNPQAGQWRVEDVRDGDGNLIVSGSVSGDSVLTVTAHQVVEGYVTLNVRYGNLPDPLPVTVYVSARVELRPAGRAALFPNDSVTWALSVGGFRPGSQAAEELLGGTLSMGAFTGGDGLVKAAASESGGVTSITLTRSGGEAPFRDTSLAAPYTYTRDGYTVENSYSVNVELLELPLKWDGESKTWSMDFGALLGENDAVSEATGGAAVDGNTVKLDDSDTLPDELTVTLTMGGLEHRVTVTKAQLDAAKGA